MFQDTPPQTSNPKDIRPTFVPNLGTNSYKAQLRFGTNAAGQTIDFSAGSSENSSSTEEGTLDEYLIEEDWISFLDSEPETGDPPIMSSKDVHIWIREDPYPAPDSDLAEKDPQIDPEEDP